jgi:hypothetical protein
VAAGVTIALLRGAESGRRHTSHSAAVHSGAQAGRVVWEPRFNRSFSGWRRKEALPGGLTVIAAPVEGRYAARFVVHPGDMPNPTGERAELDASPAETGGYEGVETWYGWSVLFPPDYHPTPGAFNIFTQWHRARRSSPPCTPGPNIAFRTSADTSPWMMEMWVTGGDLYPRCEPHRRMFRLGPIVFDRWNDFILHVRWSPQASEGFVQAFLDRRQVVPLTRLATMYTDDEVFAAQGIYRAPSDLVSTLYEQPLRRGTSRAAVQPR